jgi:predicted RNA-binding protein Jag
LETDLAYLGSCRTRLTEIDKIKSELQQKLETILTELQQEARISVEDYFVEEDYERGNLFVKADIKTRELLLTNIGDFNLFPKWLSENIKSSFEYKTAGMAAFKTEQDAADFAEKIILWAKQRAETLLFKVRQNTEIEIETARTNLAEFLIKETKPIIERARIRLQEKFEIELILPSPAIQPDDNLEVKWQLVKTKTRLVDQGYEERLVQKRAWYYWFGLIPFYRQEIYKKPYKKDNYYTVSLHDLVKQINTYIENSIEQIKQKITNYLDEDLQEQVNIFFASLDEYLGNYRDSLKQVQASQQLSLEQQEKLASNLSHLVPQTTKYLEKTDKYLQLTEPFLK